MSQFGSSPIVVTGASGWVGRTVLNQLAQLLSVEQFKSRLRAFSSRTDVIDLVDGRSVQSQPLSQLPSLIKKEGCSHLLHTAFLTPNRYAEMGIERYTCANRLIIDTIVAAVKHSPDIRVVEFSSGAASLAEENLFMDSPAVQIYGALKLDEEQRLQSVATTLVLRIYALSGRFIRDPSSYALGEFLQSALQQKRILVRSPNPVIRGYGNAGDIVRCALCWLFSNAPRQEPVAALSEITTLENLASLISAIYGLHVPLVQKLEGEPSSYSYSPLQFLSLCDSFGIVPMTMTNQILDTAEGIINSMKQ